ncbi:protein sip-5 [uncultured Stenotrophomonas sp.]|uniref:protein sip-5 n=1 Tax=uncultured Stenotrophomonas sp. TaxID=165438 RepID=UPI0025E5C923|nr:protein sip-5 [uncultured Stenotrophomonas sp.]
MNFEALQRRVRRAEAVVQVRGEEATQHWDQLNQSWRSAWTPGRIVVVGLAGGFLAGKLEPGGAFSGSRWLQMIGSVSGLVSSAQASVASFAAAAAAAGVMAGQAAADDDADQGDDEDSPPPPAAAASTARSNSTPPGPAEAATELSES